MSASFTSNDAALVRAGLFGRSEQAGRVSVDESGLSFDDQLLAAPSEVASAHLEPRADGASIVRVERVRRAGRRVATEILLRDVEAGRALLRALGFEGGQRALALQVPSRLLCDEQLRERVGAVPWAGTGLAFCLVFGSLGLRVPALTGAFVLLWLAGMLAWAAAMLGSTTLVIGADGLVMTWLGRSRYIAYSEIDVIHGLQREPGQGVALDGVQIQLVLGAPLRFWLPEATLVYERLEEAVSAWWRRDVAERAALSARRERDARTWLSALTEIGAAASTGYRTASLAEELWRIVEDAAAPIDARAGAAVALRPWVGDDGRARLERVAQTTAHTRLRVVLEAAATDDEDEEALVAALNDVGDVRTVPPPRPA